MMKVKTDFEQLDKLTTLEVIALHDYYEKAVANNYYFDMRDKEYCFAVKNRLREIIMEYTVLIFEEE